MKVISLNLWGGRIYEPLARFLKEHKDSTDFFCFQEMYHKADKKFFNAKWKDDDIKTELFDEVKEILYGHQGFFYPHFEDFWGLAMFAKTELPVFEEGEKLVH